MNHTEIELKLIADNSTLQNIRRYELFSSCNWQKCILQSTYFDDVNFTLRKHQAALRIRNNGKQLIQTLKINVTYTNNLSIHKEYEHILTVDKLNLKKIKQYLPANLLELKPIFTTVFTRQSCEVNFANSVIELALDCGKAISAKKYDDICELELELIRGDNQDIQHLSDLLRSKFELNPCSISKAARGFRLLELAND